MGDWNEGYHHGVNYVHGYYPELNPEKIKLAFLNVGLKPPNVLTACELGFGFGTSINIHAAVSSVEWYGTDINPTQVLLAQQVSAASKNGAHLYAEAFKEFCNRTDLPDFDFIALHGVWSWVSDENRAIIIEFLSKKLKTGGVVYMSYNTLPGWANYAPMRHLMKQHELQFGRPIDSTADKIKSAFDFCTQMFDVNAQVLESNGLTKEKHLAIADKPTEYLAHEYFNEDWEPMYFDQIASQMELAKLQFACSANLLDHINAINFSPEQLSLLAGIPDGSFKETVRDIISNKRFRKDYWVKGRSGLSEYERQEEMRSLMVTLSKNPSDIPTEITGALVTASLQRAVYDPVVEELSDYKPKRVNDLLTSLQSKNISFSALWQVLLVLSSLGAIALVASESETPEHANDINSVFLNYSQDSDNFQYMAAPTLKTGISVPKISQLFILALREGKTSAEELAEYVWSILEPRGHQLIADDKVLRGKSENISELQTRAQSFLAKDLQLLSALKIIT